MSDLVLIIGILVSVLASAGFSATETIFLTIDRLRLQSRAAAKDEKTRRIRFFIEAPERFVVATLVGNNLVNVLYSSLLAVLLTSRNVPDEIIFTVSPLFLLIFSESIPKALGRQLADRAAPSAAAILYYFRRAFLPIALTVESSIKLLQRLSGLGNNSVGMALTRLDFTYALTDATRGGGVSEEELKLIRRLMTLAERSVDEVMIPRTRVATINIAATVDEAIRLISQTGHKRLVCFGNNEDDLLGVIYATDLLRNPSHLSAILKPVPIVPESLPIIRLVEWLRRQRSHFALVIDEYGGFAGIVTLNDLAAEMVGPLQEAHGRTAKDCIRLSEKHWLVAGRIKLSHLTEVTGFEAGETHASTLGGLVVELAEEIPDSGEEFKVAGATLRVVRADSRGVRLVRIALNGNGN